MRAAAVRRRCNGREQEGLRFHFQAEEDNCQQRRAAAEAEPEADLRAGEAEAEPEAEAEAGPEEERCRRRRRRDSGRSNTPCTAQAAAQKEAGRFPRSPQQRIPPPATAETATGATP